MVGVCAYMPCLAGCPALVESKVLINKQHQEKDEEEEEEEEDDRADDATYFGIDGYPAHIYVVSAQGEAAARRRCDEFYETLRAKYGGGHQ